jgi:hypothetical protein
MIEQERLKEMGRFLEELFPMASHVVAVVVYDVEVGDITTFGNVDHKLQSALFKVAAKQASHKGELKT